MSRRDRGRKGRPNSEGPPRASAPPGGGASPGRAGFPTVRLGDVLLWTAIAVAISGVWRWSVAADRAPITGPGFESALRLLCGSLAFWVLGRAVIRGSLTWCRITNVQSVMHGLPVQLCAVAVGQLAAVCWLVLRSGLHEMSMRWTGFSVPVTGVEVAVLLLLALGSLGLELRLAASRVPAHAVTPWRSYAVQMASFLILVGLICLAVGFREMPRISTLSSDPDNHAYWARMVMRLGTVPWDQGLLGQGSFRYPCGYAALNASWCTLSGISVIDAVTVQPVMQFLLGCMVIAALAPWCIARSRGPLPSAPGVQVFLVSLLLMIVYWFVLPYGMQRDRYFGEGTARLSATMFTAIVVMGWLAPLTATLSPRERCIRLMAVSASLAVVAMLNPINALIVAIPATAVGLDECRRVLMRSRLKGESAAPAISVAAALVGFGALLASDPYFGDRAVGTRAAETSGSAASSDDPQPAAQAPTPMFAAPDVPIGALLRPTQALSHSFAGISAPTPVKASAALALLASLAAWITRSPARALRWLAAFPLLGMSHYVALCIPPKPGGSIPTYLIQPYLIDTVHQMGALLALCAIGAAFALVIGLGRVWLRATTAVLMLGVSWLPESSAASTIPSLVMRPRVTRLDGNLGVPTAADLDVIRYWNGLAAKIVAQRGTMTYAEAPKILILGNPRDYGVERWVTPVGGGRLLPLESPLPTAFFYGHGSGDWNYQNYLDHVCSSFDVEWLRARNVRYVFVPVDPQACIAVPAGNRGAIFRTIYETGGAALLEIQDAGH